MTKEIVINSILLREFDEDTLIKEYARHFYDTEEDCNNDVKIQENLINLLDWDKNGTDGLGLYCSRFESIKRKDWEYLINLIKDNKLSIERLCGDNAKQRKLENRKIIDSEIELSQKKREELASNRNPNTPFRKTSKGCWYKGKYYNSRYHCMYSEKLTKGELYKYLALTNQMDPDSSLAKIYLKSNERNNNIS